METEPAELASSQDQKITTATDELNSQSNKKYKQILEQQNAEIDRVLKQSKFNKELRKQNLELDTGLFKLRTKISRLNDFFRIEDHIQELRQIESAQNFQDILQQYDLQYKYAITDWTIQIKNNSKYSWDKFKNQEI